MDTVSFQYEKLMQELWAKREGLGGRLGDSGQAQHPAGRALVRGQRAACHRVQAGTRDPRCPSEGP